MKTRASTLRVSSKVLRWGNSLAVRIPADIARNLHLEEGTAVSLDADGQHLMLEPESRAPLTLEQRLALFDPARHGGEAMAWSPVGKERLDSHSPAMTEKTPVARKAKKRVPA